MRLQAADLQSLLRCREEDDFARFFQQRPRLIVPPSNFSVVACGQHALLCRRCTVPSMPSMTSKQEMRTRGEAECLVVVVRPCTLWHEQLYVLASLTV